MKYWLLFSLALLIFWAIGSALHINGFIYGAVAAYVSMVAANLSLRDATTH